MRLLFAEIREHASLSQMGKMGWVTDSIMDELLTFLVEEEKDDDIASLLELSSKMLHWVATGEGEDLPDEVKIRIATIAAAEQPKELPVGDSLIAHK